MELGGVGSPAGCGLSERDLAATAAKLSLPVQKALLWGLGMSTEAVIPAKAIAILELVFLTTGAICTERSGRVSLDFKDESDDC